MKKNLYKTDGSVLSLFDQGNIAISRLIRTIYYILIRLFVKYRQQCKCIHCDETCWFWNWSIVFSEFKGAAKKSTMISFLKCGGILKRFLTRFQEFVDITLTSKAFTFESILPKQSAQNMRNVTNCILLLLNISLWYR